MEALFDGCMTWAPRNEHYLLRMTHHRLLFYVQVLKSVGRMPERGDDCPAAAAATDCAFRGGCT